MRKFGWSHRKAEAYRRGTCSEWKGTLTAISDTTSGAFPGLEVISELGRGAETVVYRVRRRNADYALKLLNRPGADPERALTTIRREAALLACVDHPRLPQIFEVGEADPGPYLVLEFIDGSPLSHTLRGGPLDEAMAVRLAIDVVGPLAAAHRAGLVHRDVKPDNVIVCAGGAARLIDFGLVTRDGAHDGRVAGTLLYSAPEQTGMLKRAVDGRSDLYALGALLFEVVTGQTPYRSTDAGELIRLHATAPVPDPRAIRPELSPTFAAIIGKLLAKDPDDRYQNGESLLADLQRLSVQPRSVFEIGTHARGVRPTGPNLLVGRDKEVTELATRWLNARDGNGGAVLVEGPAGVGKSRLVREVTTAAATDGDLVLYGKCNPDDPVPLGPLRAAVEHYLRSVDQLPPQERELAIGRLRRAAGRGSPLLAALSPMLAALVGAPDLGGKDRHEQFTSAVAAFLLDLAAEWDGAMLHIDDVQWLDGQTRRVLQQVATGLARVPLLVVATGRDDEDHRSALTRFRVDLGATLDTRIPLNPLDDGAAADLVTLHLGGVRLAADMIDELVARAGGNPFTVVEYVRAVIDAGLIIPSWGGWRLDLTGLDRLELSGDALDLVLQRIDGLGAESRRLLAAGAATGRRFRADLVAAVCGVNQRQGRAALAEAEARRLVSASGPSGYVFLHDRIREALLAELSPAALRRLHQRIAEILEVAGSTDSRYVYATARHYALGEADRTPERVYASGFAAGRLALAEHAPAEALAFLEDAAAAARLAGLVPEPDFHLALGVSCARIGRFAEALEHMDRALQGERDELRRAGVLAQMAWVHLGSWDPGRAFDTARRGLAEVGRPLPAGRLALVLSTVMSFVTGLAIGITKIGFGRVQGPERERCRLEALFYETAGYASTMRMHLRMRAIMAFRSLHVINRLGSGTEYTRAMAGFGLAAQVIGRDRLARRIFTRAAISAAECGDPVAVAHVEWERGAGRFISGADEGQAWTRALTEHERWLELGDYLTGVAAECAHLLQVGRTREAQAWYERGRIRLGAGAQAEGAGFSAISAMIPAQLGRPQDTANGIEAMRRFLALNPDNVTQLINLFGTRILALVEQGELGEPFEHVITEFGLLGMRPRGMLPAQRIYFIYQALGRLAQCHRARRDQRAACLHRAERAVAQLGQGATNHILRAYHRVARADLAVLTNRPEAALRELVHAELEILRLNAPLVAYEAARVRARALHALGEPEPAAYQARVALMLAVEHHWTHRARWVRDEFGIAATSTAPTTPAGASTAGESAAASRSGERRVPSVSVALAGSGDALNRRRLAALQQVSLASATVLDPRQLARVALDETLRILGAERAYLFLVDPDLDQLVPNVGRDAQGNDIVELTAYSSTLVDRVRTNREALVVTGSEEGVALGSRSAQVHGLRSIMIAPLLFDGRLLGVVYLDSRVAKGMFTTDDVDILTAITTHVATSLETARAAQLAVAVQAARRQRDVAETLRAAMAEQSATLDPDEVMRRLLGALARTLDGEAAVLLSRDGDQLVVTASHGAAAPVGTCFAPTAGLLDLGGPRTADATARRLLGDPRTALAIPVAARSEPVGVVLVAADHDDPVPEAQVEVAAALAAQGMTAYENARLFSEVRRLATIDGLTGLYNRGHFFAEAGRQFQLAQRYRRPVAAIMVDVDHFKRINDTYGHPVGDQVISAIAGRLRASARDSDVLGRYGGEEFALLTPETAASAAALAERLRQEMCVRRIPTAAGPLAVTISVGMAYTDRAGEPPGQHLSQLLACADTALYEAKQNGRNRVATAFPAG
jgi:diguanylate cyclase (GGDEF)-like protein